MTSCPATISGLVYLPLGTPHLLHLLSKCSLFSSHTSVSYLRKISTSMIWLSGLGGYGYPFTISTIDGILTPPPAESSLSARRSPQVSPLQVTPGISGGGRMPTGRSSPSSVPRVISRISPPTLTSSSVRSCCLFSFPDDVADPCWLRISHREPGCCANSGQFSTSSSVLSCALTGVMVVRTSYPGWDRAVYGNCQLGNLYL